MAFASRAAGPVPAATQRMSQALRRLDEIHATHPLDVILITGDLTDAGRSAEWAEFFAALAPVT